MRSKFLHFNLCYFPTLMATILFSITGFVILSQNGWFPISHFGILWNMFGQFWLQIGDLRPEKYLVTMTLAIKNPVKICPTCTCFLTKVTSALVETVNTTQDTLHIQRSSFCFEDEKKRHNTHFYLKQIIIIFNFKRYLLLVMLFLKIRMNLSPSSLNTMSFVLHSTVLMLD